jgi:hypothetical protein
MDRSVHEDFSDSTVVLCRPEDARLGMVWTEENCGFEQAADGPVMLVIGREASDAKCQPLAERFGVSAETLRVFRTSGRAGVNHG